MRRRGVRSMIGPALLIAITATAARAQDTTATATPPNPPPAAAPPAVAPAATALPDTATKPALPDTGQKAAPKGPPLDSVPEGKALLYLFNGSGRSLIGGKYGVKSDGKKIAELPRTTYSVVPLAPGKHKLQSSSGGGKLDLTVEAGKHYFVLLAYWPDKSWATVPEDQPLFFGQVDEAKARQFIARSKRNEPLK